MRRPIVVRNDRHDDGHIVLELVVDLLAGRVRVVAARFFVLVFFFLFLANRIFLLVAQIVGGLCLHPCGNFL